MSAKDVHKSAAARGSKKRLNSLTGSRLSSLLAGRIALTPAVIVLPKT